MKPNNLKDFWEQESQEASTGYIKSAMVTYALVLIMVWKTGSMRGGSAGTLVRGPERQEKAYKSPRSPMSFATEVYFLSFC